MSVYDHTSPGITGTSTTAKVFKNSGIKKAKNNDKCLNPITGHVYNCTDAGTKYEYYKTSDRKVVSGKTYYKKSGSSYTAVSNPKKEDLKNYYERKTITGTHDIAKWAYIRTDVLSPPDLGYSNLCAPVRGNGNRKMTCTWTVPKKLVDAKNKNRATYLKTYWSLGIVGKDPKDVDKRANEALTSDTVNLDNFIVGSKTYTRNSFYPLNRDRKLSYVTFQVVPFNDRGKGSVIAKQTRYFYKPKAPSISGFTFNKENGELSCTITTNAGNDYNERYDTRYRMYIYKSWEDKTTIYHDDSTTETSKTIKYDATGYQALTYGQYIRVKVEAWARGYAGDSETDEKYYYIAYPAQATIKNVSFSGYTGTDKCTVRISTNQVKNKNGRVTHPTDKVTLEYLANVEYASASAIPADTVWSDSGNLDDGQCTALAMPVANLICDPGNWSYLRVVTYHANEDVLFRYSEYKRLDELHKAAPTAADDEIVIVSALPNADGESADVTLAWDAVDGSSADDATGTELSWDTDKNAWRSTKAPSTHEFTWYDSGSITHKGVTYRKKATITIKGLSEGETYYVRARRYLDGDSGTTYGKYSPDVEPVVMTRSAEAIVASCDSVVAVGTSLPISWTLSGGGLQKEWSVVAENGTPIASGSGSIGYTQIDASRLASFATNNVVTFTVQASSGTKPVISEPHSVMIAQRPTLSINVPQTLTTNAFSLTATASTVCDLSIVVSSQGVVGQTPRGLERQAAGDTVYSVLDRTPAWEETNGMQVATVNLPTGLDFWDLGMYTVSVTAIDRTSGLKSDEATADIKVDWTRKAPDPTDAVTITAIDEVDDSGYHIKGAEIALTPPANSIETDVYDIYRYTGDGAELIGQSFPLTHTARDLYAPFSEDGTQHYRIAIRTIDGDTEFVDIEYIAEGEFLRFDWAEGYLELPYGVTMGDSYSKDVEFRKHMDGGTDGYWNENIERKGSYSSAVIKLIQPAEIDMARRLARFAGAVYVRTPEGTAYLADVQVTDLSRRNEAVMMVAFDATEVDLTQEYMLPTPFEREEEA